MEEHERRPVLRLVGSAEAVEEAPVADEGAAATAATTPAPTEGVPSAPAATATVAIPHGNPQSSVGARIFRAAVDSVPAAEPARAAQMVLAGLQLVDAALAIHHQAVAHAPAGTFRGGITPGLRSAEATRAWLGTHLASIARLPASTRVYERAADLRDAAVLAARELDRAVALGTAVELPISARAEACFTEARDRLLRTPRCAAPPRALLYLDGVDAIGALVDSSDKRHGQDTNVAWALGLGIGLLLGAAFFG